MSSKDKLFFLRTALLLRMIDLKQYNIISEIWEGDRSKDTKDILLEKGFITKGQLGQIEAAIRRPDEATMHQTRGAKDSRPQEADLYTENYTLRGLIGQGSTGRVFLGFDKNIEREVAIKELSVDSGLPEYDNIRSRFVREAKITGQLEHPGVVPVYDLGFNDDGTIYYTMKFVRGKTFFDAMGDCQADSPEEAFRMRMKLLDSLINVSEAVGYAHANNIIHRDLKPGNIVLGQFGETVILDWGLAKNLGTPSQTKNESCFERPGPEPADFDPDKTKAGKLLGTPSYMSPEQADARFGEVDQRSDVYSLGVILFMLLTGEKIYQGGVADILRDLTSDNETPSPSKQLSFIPPELAAICKKATAKKRETRFANASEFANELKAYRDGRLISTYAYSKRELFKRFVVKNKATVIATVVVFLSTIIGGGLAIDFGIKAHKSRLAAENALMDITALSQLGVDVSRKSVSELEMFSQKLLTDLTTSAKKFDNIGLKDNLTIDTGLEQLHSKYPAIEAFGIVSKSGIITNLYPKTHASVLNQDVSAHELMVWMKEHKTSNFSRVFQTKLGFHAVVLQVPILNDKKLSGIILALIRPDKLIASVLSISPKESPFQIWCMQDDGYILYDEDPSQVGLHLFQDKRYADYPELLNLGEQMKKFPWGVGNYQYFNKNNDSVVHKVAVWDTFKPSDTTEWKLVVSHPYIIKKY